MAKRILFIDFETRSEADLSEVGAHRYNMDTTTEMLLCAYAFDNQPEQVCDYVPDEVYKAIEDNNVIKVAHNAEFDMAVCKYVLKIDITLTDWFDTAFQAAYYGLPRSLEQLAIALNTTRKASQEELKLFSVPVALAQEAPKDEFFAVATPTRWNTKETHPAQWETFRAYAGGDVAVMRECYNKMAQLPEIELLDLHQTFELNFNGFGWDVQLSHNIYNKSQEYSDAAREEAQRIYGIANLRSHQQVKKALKLEGITLESLNAKLRGGVEHPILELWDRAAGSSFSKIPTAFARICPDRRIRGEFLGRGARTGRKSAKGTQPQNFARILAPDKVNESLEHVDSYDLLRQHIRLCITAQNKKQFSVADLSQIEARIVAWLANCKWRMEAFANGEDIYARSAEKMFGLSNVTKDMIERFYGKTYELALGYGGGGGVGGAVDTMSHDFFVKRGAGKVQDDVSTWRSANPEIKSLWYSLQDAFVRAYKTGMHVLYVANGVPLTFRCQNKTMRISVPSGRHFYYRGVEVTPDKYGYSLSYLDYSKGHAVRTHFWGGKILENITQGFARDILVDIVRRVKERLPDSVLYVGTVHDEIWYEHDASIPVLDVVLEEMARPIEWAKGLITKGDGNTSDRYRK